MALTQKAIDDYLASPYHCPYCNSENIEGGDLDWDEPLGQSVSCSKCGKSWTDILKVVGIIESLGQTVLK